MNSLRVLATINLVLGGLVFLLGMLVPWLTPKPGPGALQVITPLLNIARLFLELFLSVHQALFSLVNLVFGIGAVALLADSYSHTRVPRLRQQLRAIGIG